MAQDIKYYQSLSRSVGRFVWIRGNSIPAHFMPLKDFHLDVALDASVIVALRTLRSTGSRELVNVMDISEWISKLAIEQLTSTIKYVFSSGFNGNVYEVGSVSGALFESLKVEGVLNQGKMYYGCGHPTGAHRFMEFHKSDSHKCGWIDEVDVKERISEDPNSLLILNHNQAIRHGHCQAIDIFDLAINHKGPVIFALRWDDSEVSGQRVTVNGHVAHIPNKAEILSRLALGGKSWRVLNSRNFDTDFFIPDGREKAQLLIGVGAEGVDLPSKYHQLDTMVQI